jgi:hypothetical protein
LGPNLGTIFVLTIVFAFIEEVTKPLALFPIRKKPGPMAFYGSICGLSFFAMESILIGIISVFSIPGAISKIIYLRTGTAFMHLVSSCIVGAGIGKNKKLHFILLATSVHAVYNLTILGVIG